MVSHQRQDTVADVRVLAAVMRSATVSFWLLIISDISVTATACVRVPALLRFQSAAGGKPTLWHAAFRPPLS